MTSGGGALTAPFDLLDILDAIPLPIFCKDEHGVYILVNREFEKYIGRQRHEVIHRPAEKFLDNKEAKLYRAADLALLKEGGVQRYETESYWAESDSVRPVVAYKSLFPYDNGERTGIIGLIVDVSTRKWADDQQLLEQILRVLPAGLVWTDKNLVIEGCNETFADELVLPGSIVGLGLGDVSRWVDADQQLAALTDVIETGRPQMGERFQVAGLNGEAPRTLESHRVPLLDGDDEVKGLLSLSFDVTNRLEMETKLATASRLESIGQLAAGVAHEINTPAQFVRDNVRFAGEGVADLLAIVAAGQQLADAARTGGDLEAALAAHAAAVEDGDLEFLVDELPSALTQSMEGIERVSHIVRAMKDTSHPGRDVTEPVNLNRLIDSTTVVAATEWKYVADLGLDVDDDLPEVTCRASQISQVILNLVVNAAHAISDVISGADKGRIDITTHHDHDYAVITVADTGPGIPPEARSRIFDPFFTTKAVGQGTGQGLAMAYSVIVKAHGGELSFDTEMGEGTTFTIRLPIDGGGTTTPPIR